MGLLWTVSLAVATWAEVGAHSPTAQAAGAAMEGKETRFGEWASALFAVATTGTSTGAVNASHDSLTPAGGGTVLVNMMLGEVVPGGVGAGIYGILVMAILTVFVAGLMVGPHPGAARQEDQREADDVRRPLHADAPPALVLVGTGAAIARADTAEAMGNPGGHGFSEVLYAYTSAANNNGSAFGGLTVTSDFFQVTLALAMLLGRLLPIVLVLVLAGSLAEQGKVPVTAGTLPTHTPLFVGMLVGVIVILTGLTYFPALALGPIAEALMSTHDVSPPRLHNAAADLIAQLLAAGARGLRKLDPRHLWRSPVMFLVLLGSVATTVAADRRPECLHGVHRGLAVAHRALRQPRRGRRGGSRQGAGRLAARRPHRHRGPAPRPPTAPRPRCPRRSSRSGDLVVCRGRRRRAQATATSSRASRRSTSPPSPASPPRSSARPAATGAR